MTQYVYHFSFTDCEISAYQILGVHFTQILFC